MESPSEVCLAAKKMMEMKVNLNKRTILDFPTTTKRLVDGPINLPSEALAIFPAFSISMYQFKRPEWQVDKSSLDESMFLIETLKDQNFSTALAKSCTMLKLHKQFISRHSKYVPRNRVSLAVSSQIKERQFSTTSPFFRRNGDFHVSLFQAYRSEMSMFTNW